jgi:hypothetical protein
LTLCLLTESSVNMYSDNEMNYRDNEKTRTQKILNAVIRARGNGQFGKKRYEFVLDQGELNLWDGIREDALDYFKKYNIAWWRGGPENIPTGHLFSSQVACLNHLYWLRTRKDAALAMARGLHSDVDDVEIIDGGYIAFEVVGEKNYLCERSHGRGANATAFDAVMIAKKKNGNNLLIAIEWKYTEKYNQNFLYKPARAKIYDQHLDDPDGPLKVDKNEALYYEPHYQLMRQALLSWKMVQAREHSVDEYLHVHVIPNGNKELLDVNTSPLLNGSSLHEAWQSVLKDPGTYNIIDPQDLLAPVMKLPETKSIFTYLKDRYWGFN